MPPRTRVKERKEETRAQADQRGIPARYRTLRAYHRPPLLPKLELIPFPILRIPHLACLLQ